MLENEKPESTQGNPKKCGLFCPSAQPQLSGSMLLALVEKSSDGARVSYLERPVKVTDGTVLAFTAGPTHATSLFRFAAPCATSGCRNWEGSSCRVAQRMVQILPATANELPNCKLRPRCRWYDQEGAAACQRCPQAITDDPSFEAALNQHALAEAGVQPANGIPKIAA
jgi:hypothetical protein